MRASTARSSTTIGTLPAKPPATSVESAAASATAIVAAKSAVAAREVVKIANAGAYGTSDGASRLFAVVGLPP